MVKRALKRRIGWALLAVGAYAGGVLVAVYWANIKADADGHLSVDILVWQVVVGTLLIGIGQVLSLAAHDPVPGSRGGVTLDGIGKTVALGGWSLGLMATIGFAGEGSNVSEAVAGQILGIATVFVPVLLISGLALVFIFGRTMEEQS